MHKLINRYMSLDRIDRLGIETIAMLIFAFAAIITAGLLSLPK